MSARWAARFQSDMPTRLLREGILTSERVAALSWQAEVFYRRLMSVVDDYGRYFAKPMALRAGCFPLQLDRVKDSEIEKWLAECVEQNLLRVYEAERSVFLELLDFRQLIRAKKSKYPDPTGVTPSAQQKKAAPENNDRNSQYRESAAQVIAFLNEKAGRNFDGNGANAQHVIARLKDGETVDDMRAVVAKKCREWKGDPKMDAYLRPETLFNRTKYASYKGELVVAG